MTIRHLKVFIKVCETLSISKTAEELCVAQPSVSQTIKELENYYDISLFIRTRKGVVLTKEGEILLAKAKSVTKEFDDFEDLAKQDNLNYDVKIGCTLSYGEYNLTRIDAKLKDAIPNINPIYYVDTTDNLVDDILKGDIDFAFTEKLPNSPLIQSKIVGEDDIAVVARPSYKIKDKLTLEELVKYPLYLREKSSFARSMFEMELTKRGLTILNKRMVSISNNALISIIKGCDGLALVPRFSVINELNDGSLKEIKLDISLNRQLYVIYLKNKNFNQITNKALTIGSNDSIERFKK